MKRAVLLALLMAGGQTTEERMAADDAQCRSYGTRVGDPAYIQCRMNLDSNRGAVKASERFATGSSLFGTLERAADR